MGILASLSLSRKLLLAVLLLFVGGAILVLSLDSSIGKLSPVSYPGKSAEKPFAKLMTSKMIPGNPFYTLLMLRDRVELQFITDPVQNAQKRIDLANTRLQTSETLFADGDVELGLSTISKAEQYLATATVMLQKSDVSKLAVVQSTLLEHAKVMTAIKANLSDADKARMDQVLDLNASLIHTISQR